MTTIFISYSRVDAAFKDKLVYYLRRTYDHQHVWVDENLHAGQLWWDEIVAQIVRCDVFILLVSPESLASTYCMKELTEARQRGKHIIPVLVRARTPVPPDIKKLHMIKMPNGIEPDGLTDLYAAINNRRQRSVVQNRIADPTRPARRAQITRPASVRFTATIPRRMGAAIGGGSLTVSPPEKTPRPAPPTPPRTVRPHRGWWGFGGSAVVLLLLLFGMLWYMVPAGPPTQGSVYIPANITMTDGNTPGRGLALHYNADTLYLVNEADVPLDASGLFFVHGERAFHSDTWFDRPLGRLEPGDCVQLWSVEIERLPPPDSCQRQRWRQVAASGVFWHGEGAFVVRRDGEDLVNCPVTASRCALPSP